MAPVKGHAMDYNCNLENKIKSSKLGIVEKTTLKHKYHVNC